ncbi:MAG: GNAT family N-acetyltransferase [Halobaculum sp.]
MPGPTFLESERVTLHPLESDDTAFVHRVSNDERVWQTGFTPFPSSRGDIESFVESTANGEDRVDLLVAVDGDRAGVVSLTDVDYRRRGAELGYWFAPEFHGEGYASEAARRVVRYAFETLDLARIEAHVDAFNDPSIGLLESVGFTREGTRRAVRVHRGERVDMHTYGLLASEWEREEGESERADGGRGGE